MGNLSGVEAWPVDSSHKQDMMYLTHAWGLISLDSGDMWRATSTHSTTV